MFYGNELSKPKHMKLRSPEAFWLLKNGILNSYPSLQENISCDIAVIGAGITGALISHALHKAGYDTVVIDKRDVANGSTAATTSLLQYEIDTMMVDLAKMIGEEGAVACYRAGVQSIHTLKKLVKKERIDGGFERKQSLQVAHAKEEIPQLLKEYWFRKKHGFDVTWLSSEEIKERFKMDSHPGILSKEGASIDAFLLAHELFHKNNGQGLRIYDHTAIREITYGDRVAIETEQGHRVECKRVVFCTGYEALSMFREKYAKIKSTFVTVSEQNINLYNDLKDVVIWDTANPYIYLRTTDDKRLLVGGEDIGYKYDGISDKLKNKKAERLIDKARKLFPSLHFTKDYNWAGPFGVTKDGLPYMGTHHRYKNALFILGFGGNGITYSVQGMKLVLKLLAEEEDPLLHYYRFDR